ncbi:cysteine proteinase [Leucogyrophana mollusca]|uniref:Cysteine proteinase n=1 Tax=Leucogyrophana mollusca TaxID=85980 RepID=A0ACB8BZJ3_9AGAM|nr:cysteine proteinase [Leucogyrophana mollusca]
MVLESLGIGFPWSWSTGNLGSSSHETKKLKKKHVRSRVEQLELNGHARPGAPNSVPNIESSHALSGDQPAGEGYYPGLVNISGTYCFMNSTLQAMASLSYLQPYLVAIHAKAEALDVPSPVIDALLDLLHELNSPRSSYSSIRPLDIISALVDHSPGKHNSLFSSREHQDAQELFQLVSECIKKEAAAVDREGHRDRGLGGLSQTAGQINRELGKSVFDGLTANRRSCVECGYTEAVMHFSFDSWQLALPRYSSCRLEDCLADYTKLELLTDCICRKCSMIATHQRLVQEADRLTTSANADPNASISRKKRAKEARKLEQKVKAAIDYGRIEEDTKGVKMEKVLSKASTKQAMIARPPPVLALHLNRSLHYGQYASKNNIRVVFPEILDLTPFTTSGNISTVPSVPMSSPPPALPRSTTPTPATYATPRTIYRLSAVVCHYGQHSFGHYVCYRRKPRPPWTGPRRFASPKLADPLGCECEKCQRYGPVRDDDDALDSMYRPGHGWLRISDDSVRECGIETVLQEGTGAFMLYYERVVQSRPGIYPLHNSPRSSEETLKPQHPTSDANGSAASSLASLKMDVREEMERSTLGARVVRSVAAGRGRSLSKGLSVSQPDMRHRSLSSSSTSSSISSHRPLSPSPRRLQSPQPLHPSPMVNLKV